MYTKLWQYCIIYSHANKAILNWIEKIERERERERGERERQQGKIRKDKCYAVMQNVANTPTFGVRNLPALAISNR